MKSKFYQNTKLKEKLLATGNKTLAEASPKNNHWGIGCQMYSKMATNKNGWGKNLMGKLLMEVRKELKE